MALWGTNAAWANVPEIDAAALAARLKGPNPPLLLDVREPEEVAESRIGNPMAIPLGSLASRLSEVPKDKPVVVYCHSGRRSAMATALLEQSGYKNIENLKGGILAWQRAQR